MRRFTTPIFLAIALLMPACDSADDKKSDAKKSDAKKSDAKKSDDKVEPTAEQEKAMEQEKAAGEWTCYDNPANCGGTCPSGKTCKRLHNMNCGCV